jgi:hypothetical protein
MTARSQVDKLRRAADRAARVARETRVSTALWKISRSTCGTRWKKRAASCAPSISLGFRWKKSLPHCSPACWTSRNVDTRRSSSETILAEGDKVSR